MIVTQKDSCIVLDFLECDGIAEECHLVAASIVVKPEVIEAVACCLPFVGRITDIEHDCWLLTKELFKNYSHDIKYLRIVGAMFVLAIVNKEMVSLNTTDNTWKNKLNPIIKNIITNPSPASHVIAPPPIPSHA